MRLSPGEIDWPDDNARRVFVREKFLDAVSAHAPEVCENLYSEVLPLYSKDASPEESTALANALAAWSHKYHLESDWCVEAAYKGALWFWAQYEVRPERLRWHSMPARVWSLLAPLLKDGPRSPVRANLPASLDGVPEYNPLTETRESYLANLCFQALKTYQSHPLLNHFGRPEEQKSIANSPTDSITNYCAAVEDSFLRVGYKRRSPDDKRELLTHLEWTIEFQILERSFQKIADEASVTPKAVSKAVRQVLDDISLSERPVKSGRPKGSRTVRHAHNPSSY